ncbi:FAD-dependent monooxygenase [Pseudooceanicola algae]|uniref:6-hydroxynicotinate 3-monooxygenase n=1 Tax=Pseudooceanicola algae TaxID=1537215 RepID=A0A418SJV2_9RHOB|nr:FAD-dependent monooxygenase [Pseudooceanicola algae]QPM92245.1 6-hydroxynicotinate 3-monooxygenase [Pseudooceanicola algae]
MLKIGICGGGPGGLVAALALVQQGHDVTVYERTSAYGRIGADINLTPNAGHALDGLGIGAALRETAARPQYRISRVWDTGAETSRLEMQGDRYESPQLTIHRADLITALSTNLPEGVLQLGAKVRSVTPVEGGAEVALVDGSTATFDLVIGADGIHSLVRKALFGEDDPKYTGLVSYRAVFPRDRAQGIPNLNSFTKWWGPTPDRQLVVFPLKRGEEVFVFATTAQDDWSEEGWTLPGDIDALREAYADFHPEARAILACCDEVTRSALHVREPMPAWSKGHVTIMGDAAHPMVPFMAQGATMAIEDGVVLALALKGADAADVPAALARYEAARRDRTARVQRGSLANEWLKQPENADWVYAYKAWEVFSAPETAPAADA